jgi:hypothetical protein
MNPFMIPVLDTTSKWILKACAILALLTIAALLVFNWGHARGVQSMRAPLAEARAASADAKAAHQLDLARHAQVLREQAERAAHVADLARVAQTTYIEDRAAAARKHEQELAHAIAEKERLIAGHRAGSVQLQPWWECPSVLPAVGGVLGAGTAGSGPEADAGAVLRAASLAEGVQDGLAADAWIHNLQSELTATRKACQAVQQVGAW